MDPDELAEARAEIALYFDQTATVNRDTASTVPVTSGQTVSDNRGGRVSDTRGGFADSEATEATYPCRLAEHLRPPEMIEAGAAPTSMSRWVVSLPFDADVRFRDQLVINGNTYRVEASNAGVSDALCVSAECERIS